MPRLSRSRRWTREVVSWSATVPPAAEDGWGGEEEAPPPSPAAGGPECVGVLL